MQLVPSVHGGPRVGEHGAAHGSVVAHVPEFDLAEVEARYEVKESPQLVLCHPQTAKDMEDTTS